tara:strand:+ start:3126 stop:3641 length:516 start_codon:yes stop_codon:yes gene_type:complete
MATIFEAGGLQDILAPAFVFIFVFAIVFALLKKIKIFGGNDGVNAIVAFIIGAFTIMVPESTVVIGSFLPWFFLLFFLILVIFMFFMFLGVRGEEMADVAKSSAFVSFMVIMIIILFLVAMTKAFGPFLMVTGGTGFWAMTKTLIFSKKVLGLIFMLFVAAYAVTFIASKE